ncbi:MAG TPA: ABC transporter ATP-binding protein [Candidatus Faecaligallichristensenella faecipullorum]|nr:ABC transporter ATP-binding protein [Candidatus Faecaligallichristensenella faecipullorum]
MDIEFKRVNKAFDGRPVLEGFSAVFPEGRVSAITGPSGQGKTTVLRLLSGELKPDSGEISGLSDKRVSMVFQEDRLVGALSVKDNLAMVLPKDRWGAIEPALCALGLEGAAPRQAAKLSGGMRRRVAILRAMLVPFDLLLLDEPFKGLDKALLEICARTIREKAQGKTVVLVTHDEREARLLGAENWIAL